MADNAFSAVTSGNGEYKFDKNVVRVGLGATTLGSLAGSLAAAVAKRRTGESPFAV
jgi:hypothetical protein